MSQRALKTVPPPASVAPTITLTLGELLLAKGALEHVLELKLPVGVLYHVAKLLRLTQVEAQTFEERRIALLREHGTERPATEEEAKAGAVSVFVVAPEKQAPFATQVRELTTIEMTIAARPLTLAEFGDVAVTGADLFALGPFVVEG